MVIFWNIYKFKIYLKKLNFLFYFDKYFIFKKRYFEAQYDISSIIGNCMTFVIRIEILLIYPPFEILSWKIFCEKSDNTQECDGFLLLFKLNGVSYVFFFKYNADFGKSFITYRQFGQIRNFCWFYRFRYDDSRISNC